MWWGNFSDNWPARRQSEPSVLWRCDACLVLRPEARQHQTGMYSVFLCIVASSSISCPASMDLRFWHYLRGLLLKGALLRCINHIRGKKGGRDSFSGSAVGRDWERVCMGWGEGLLFQVGVEPGLDVQGVSRHDLLRQTVPVWYSFQ